MRDKNFSDVVFEANEGGIQQIRIYADSPQQRDRGLELLLKVSPQLRALELALREKQK